MVAPKTLIALLYKFETNIQLEKNAPKINNIKPTIQEQYKLILNEVLNNDFNFSLSFSYSAVYFITPILMAPLAKVSTMLIKFEKAPIKATPPVPVTTATTLFAKKPELIRIKVIIAEKKDVFTRFNIIKFNFSSLYNSYNGLLSLNISLLQ